MTVAHCLKHPDWIRTENLPQVLEVLELGSGKAPAVIE